ncbi:MAG TPA: hypothetical protein VHO90_13820 [Bacteroidales bacterium]|nr:hypothetical protein [Bacteroidales bacterium]
MHLNKKVKAFTLVELTVTLLLSGLVVFAALQVINLFSGLLAHENQSSDRSAQLFQFQKALNNDMQQSVRIEHYDDEAIFHVSAELSISYKLDYDYTIRSVNEVVDTFFVSVDQWHIVNEKSSGLPLILEVEIKNEESENEVFRFIKDYDNDVLLNTTELKILD